MTNIFIYSENGGQTRSISRYLREKADGVEGLISTALVNDASSNLDEYFDAGVDRVYQVTSDAISGYNLEQYREAIMKAIVESSSSIILFSSTKRGTELASSVAALMNAGCMSGCHELELSSEGITVKKYVLGGSVISEQTSKGEIHVATLSPGQTDYEVRASSIREQVDLTVDVPSSRVTIKEQIAKKKTASNIKDAKIIVSGGRGLKKQEDVKLLEDLADALDASVGCTRPIAADYKWFEEWIGISGQKVAPELYVACGISGTIQHLSGIRDSKIIISINSDPNASIHNVSDYSVIADLYEVLPVLTEKLGK